MGFPLLGLTIGANKVDIGLSIDGTKDYPILDFALA